MEIPDDVAPTYQNSVGQESLDRFDQNSNKPRRKKRHKPILTRKNTSIPNEPPQDDIAG